MKRIFKLKWFLVLLAVAMQFGASPRLASAPDFTLSSLTGESYTLSENLGKQPILVVFFATWCPPCAKEIPSLIQLRNKYKEEDLQIIAIDLNEDKGVVSHFAEQMKINYTVLLDTGGEVGSLYNVRAIPTNLVFDGNGKLDYSGVHLPIGKIERMLKKNS